MEEDGGIIYSVNAGTTVYKNNKIEELENCTSPIKFQIRTMLRNSNELIIRGMIFGLCIRKVIHGVINGTGTGIPAYNTFGSLSTCLIRCVVMTQYNSWPNLGNF